MNVNTFKGYVLIVVSCAVMLAVVVLVALQWGNAAEFSAYGKIIDIDKVNGRTTGGVNTALLMLCSAAGGIVTWYLLKALILGLRALLRGRKQEQQATAAKRLSQLEHRQAEQQAGQN